MSFPFSGLNKEKEEWLQELHKVEERTGKTGKYYLWIGVRLIGEEHFMDSSSVEFNEERGFVDLNGSYIMPNHIAQISMCIKKY